MVKEFNLKDLFPDCETIDAASTSNVIYRLRYGRNGEGLELSLFHSEDKGDSEYHLNIFEIDKQNDVHNTKSFDATALKLRITKFCVDVIDEDDKNVDKEKIKKILSENGIKICSISNDCGW